MFNFHFLKKRKLSVVGLPTPSPWKTFLPTKHPFLTPAPSAFRLFEGKGVGTLIQQHLASWKAKRTSEGSVLPGRAQQTRNN